MPKEDRNRKNYDIPPEIDYVVKQYAAEFGVPESQIVSYLVAKGLLSIDGSDFWERLRPSRSMRYRSNVDIEDLLDELRNL
jgi:hypothetical protein